MFRREGIPLHDSHEPIQAAESVPLELAELVNLMDRPGTFRVRT